MTSLGTSNTLSAPKSRSAVTRRTVVRGAAWTVPVVSMAAAAPAYAISGSVSTSLIQVCKSPGNSCKSFPTGYVVEVNICNNTNETITIDWDNVGTQVIGGTLGGAPVVFDVRGDATTPGDDVVIAPGACKVGYVLLDNNGSSPNTTVGGTLSYVYTYPGGSKTATVALTAASTPECDFPGGGAGGHCPPGFD